MKIRPLAVLIAASLLCLGSFTPKAWSEPAHITCFSGNQVIYEGKSLGAVTFGPTENNFNFVDAKTGESIRIFGAACKMRYILE